jgi:hypothetical protein
MVQWIAEEKAVWKTECPVGLWQILLQKSVAGSCEQ